MKRAGWGVVVCGLLLAQVSARRESTPEADALDRNAMREFARLGRGFLVWERFKDNSWQIWSKQLDGTSEERLVPAESGRDHFCPKISPDGSMLAYMSYPRGSNAYPSSPTRTGSLWLMNLRNGTREKVVPEARSYGEDRAVVWRDARTFCFINGAGETMEMTLERKGSKKVIEYQDDQFGYLPSPDLRHATTGVPEFASLGPDGSLMHRNVLEGCQPYFTSDSLWGFWMDGSGGPIGAMFLPTRHVHPILKRDDDRLPKTQNYVYFPMISHCMRLLTFGASHDEHSHFQGNYDVFLTLVNPTNLEAVGKPVRYTKFEGCDRYPDVFRRELELGTHFIESGGKVHFAPERGNLMCDFDFGDGSTGHAHTADHTYKRPGEYWVTAVFGKGSHRRQAQGFVHVDPPSVPELVQTERESDRALLVKFDRSVDISQASAQIGAGPHLRPELTMAGRGIRIALPPGIAPDAALTLEGVRGLSGEGSTVPKATLPLRAAEWPSTVDGLIFAWRDALSRDSAGAGKDGALTPRDLAFWDRRGAMKLRGGSFDAAEGGKRISQACAQSNAFTFEAVITPQPLSAPGRERVIATLGESDGTPNLSLRQKGKQLSLHLLCGTPQRADVEKINDLGAADPNESHHLAITFEGGSLTAYVDGRRKKSTEPTLGGLAEWKPGHLRFGPPAGESNPWRGQIERVAFYDRALSPEEVMTHASHWWHTAESQHGVREWIVKARLVETTPAPLLADIQPYKEALVRQLYEVEETLSGDGRLPKQILVTQWAWIGGKAMPAQSLKTGDRVQLTLHEPEAHPELKPLVVKDSLTQSFEAREYHDSGEWDQVVKRE